MTHQTLKNGCDTTRAVVRIPHRFLQQRVPGCVQQRVEDVSLAAAPPVIARAAPTDFLITSCLCPKVLPYRRRVGQPKGVGEEGGVSG